MFDTFDIEIDFYFSSLEWSVKGIKNLLSLPICNLLIKLVWKREVYWLKFSGRDILITISNISLYIFSTVLPKPVHNHSGGPRPLHVGIMKFLLLNKL